MQALGLIETRGFVAAAEAADSALKAASVSLLGQKRVGSGLVTVIIQGDVAAVKAGVEAGTESASAVGEVISAQVIASPHKDLAQIMGDSPAPKGKAKPAAAKPEPKTKKSPGV